MSFFNVTGMRSNSRGSWLRIQTVLYLSLWLTVDAYDVLNRAEPFPLQNVRLLDGAFKRAMERDAEYLLELKPDRLLSWYRKEAGLEPKAPAYGGWEKQTIAGHSLGHYLSACSLMYASTGDERFSERVRYIVEELRECQRAHGDGYVGAMPGGKAALERMAAGEIEAKPFDLNGIWVPFYTLHKVLAGLLDAHRYCTNQTALEVACALADWIDEKTAGLTDEQMQKVLSCEHGGMVEVMAELYARTGKAHYLRAAERFYHRTVMDPLLGGRDILPGLHGNTQIPKVIGIGRLYELTGDWRYRIIAEFFWDRAVGHHSYAIGGITEGEYFGDPDRLSNRLGQHTCETCKTYNLLKLTHKLFGWNVDARKADYYERALYNHILSSQHPDTGMMIYYLPLAAGAKRVYSTRDDSFWCCVGTGMENHARYGEFIYWRIDDGVLVNLFIPSQLKWGERGIKITQNTLFPAEDKSAFKIDTEKPQEFALAIRVPHWVMASPEIRVNGKVSEVSCLARGYLSVKRRWQNGDVLTVRFPMGLWVEPMRDNTNRVALMYGPVVLTADLGSDNRPVTNVMLGRFPVLVHNGRPVNQWIQPIAGRPLEFRTIGVGRPTDWTLKPLWLLHDRRYSVYFDVLTEKDWDSLAQEWESQQTKLSEIEKRTIDIVVAGDDASEAMHDLQSSESGTGEYGWRTWRQAVRGGWFQYKLKSDPNQPVEIAVTYIGRERGARQHDIIVEGQKIATHQLDAPAPGGLATFTFQVPSDLTRGKETITVRLQARPENTTGRVVEIRVIRAKNKN